MARASTENRLGLVSYPSPTTETEETTFGNADIYKLVAETVISSHEKQVGSSWKSATSPGSDYARKFRGTAHISAQMMEKDSNGNYVNIGGVVDCGFSWEAAIITDSKFLITYSPVDSDGVDGPHGPDETGLVIALSPKPTTTTVEYGGGITAAATAKAGYRDAGTGALTFKVTWQFPTVPKLEITAPAGTTSQSATVSPPGLSVSYYVSEPPE